MPAEEKLVKEEVTDEDDGRSLSSLVKDKKKKSINGSVEARVKVTKVKKEEPKDEDSGEDDEPAIKKVSKKADKEKKKKKKMKKEVDEKKAFAAVENGKKKEKKVFTLPGQKRDPPEERDPLRIFYETLYQQLPGSEMAAFWMMEYGLLPMETAKKVYEKKQKKNQLQKLSSPIKAVASVKRVTNSVTVKVTKSSPASSVKVIESKTVLKQSKKRKFGDGSSENESDDDDDFVPLAKKKARKERGA